MVMEDHDELCALCGKRARMLCESDQAKLCWDCDRSVHGANFLVAKHVRVLLCRLCHSPTPWKASGPSLTPTSSICHRCVPTTTQSPGNHHHVVHDHDRAHDVDDDESYDDDDDDDDEEESDGDEEEEEEEGENQVVPWSSSPAAPSEVVGGGVGSSTNSEDNDGDMSSNTASRVFPSPFNLKRFPHNSIHHSDDDEDDIGCSSSEGLANDESSSMSMFRPLKQPRLSQREAAQWHNQRWGRTPTED